MDNRVFINDRIDELFALDQRIEFMPLWRLGINGTGVTVALLDSGIQCGYQATHLITENIDFTDENDATRNVLPHASTMAGKIHMVAPFATIANLKVIPSQHDPSRSDVEHAIDHCIANFPRIRIINLSLWFEPAGCKEFKCPLCKKINEAVNTGLVVVTAAGNRGPKPDTLTCPAFAEQAISVAATWSRETEEWWNNLSRMEKWWWKFSGKFEKSFGTSFSTAYVSGAIALIVSGVPQASPSDISWALKKSALDLGAPQAAQGAGLIRSHAAYQLLQERLLESPNDP